MAGRDGPIRRMPSMASPCREGRPTRPPRQRPGADWQLGLVGMVAGSSFPGGSPGTFSSPMPSTEGQIAPRVLFHIGLLCTISGTSVRCKLSPRSGLQPDSLAAQHRFTAIAMSRCCLRHDGSGGCGLRRKRAQSGGLPGSGHLSVSHNLPSLDGKHPAWLSPGRGRTFCQVVASDGRNCYNGKAVASPIAMEKREGTHHHCVSAKWVSGRS
jgi:hypothetical protein